MTAHFGEMLLMRRRELGLSIQQVANTIKIRPQIIEYFETENFPAMPPRGYAQGMISSYARYLGLNPRTVVDAYFESLSAFERSMPGASVNRYQECAPEASPRSANATGRFMLTEGPVPSSRYASRPMQAGYVSESRSPHEPMSATSLRSASAPRGHGRSMPRHSHPDQAREARASHPQDGYRDSRRPPQRPSGSRGGAGGTYTGERRRPAGSGGSRGSRRGKQAARPGAAGGLDPRVLIGAGLAVLLALALIIMAAMRGCAPASEPVAADSQQPAGSSADADTPPADDTSDDADGSADDADAADSGDDDADADSDSDSDAEEPKETKVKVKLSGEGTVAWLEVKLDGKSVLAAEEVGPFEREFTVTEQIDITTNKPGDVTVYKNGEKVRYDTKTSGVAKVSIMAPKPKKTDGDDAAADGTSGSDASEPNGTADGTAPTDQDQNAQQGA